MSILYTVIAFPIILGILVVVHEWGHFIVARMCGIRVDEFSIGFGPRAARIGKLGETEYNIRWIPLGGFVKIAGMEPDEEPILRARDKIAEAAGKGQSGRDETLATAGGGDLITTIPLIAENTPNFAETDEQRERDERDGFYAHPIWQRALVIFAGPFMSFALGYVTIFGLMMAYGAPGPPLNRIDQVLAGSEAQKIGLRSGDVITNIDGKPITDGLQMVTLIHQSAGKVVHLVVKRGNQTQDISGTPRLTTFPDGTKVGAFGFTPIYTTQQTSFRGAVGLTNAFTAFWFSQIAHLLERHNLSEIRQNAGGPIFIVQKTHEAVTMGGREVVFLAAQLTMSLALFNLLPIPILDGGHLLVFAIEGLRRGRRLTMEQQQNFMLAGLAVIGVLFVLIMFNDVLRGFHPGGQ